MNQVCFNGNFLPSDVPVLPAANRGYRFGDGLFETMRWVRGNILLEQLHFNRLFAGLDLMKMKLPGTLTTERLKGDILTLCRKNKCEELARVRLSVSRGNGGLYDESGNAEYLIESWPLDEAMNRLNENGLVTGIFPGARKSCDPFSGLKSASFLPYVMAALYAKEQKWNDCFVLNSTGNLADSTIANLFIVKKGHISTPALSEGCVAGVMRQYLLNSLREDGREVTETMISPADLQEADEVFLTNAIRGIRWVGRSGDTTYSNDLTGKIYGRFIKTIFT